VQWADRVSRFILRTLPARSAGKPIVLALAGRDPAIAADMALPETDSGIGDAERRRLHQRFATHLIAAGCDLLAVAVHARAAACSGDAASARVLLEAAEKLSSVSAEDAGELALLASRILRPAHPGWLDVGRRCLTLLARTQRAADALAIADVILARVDDADLAGQIETDMPGRFGWPEGPNGSPNASTACCGGAPNSILPLRPG
jgi:hypothetical protein